MQKEASKGEKTLLSSLLLSAPGPLVTGYAVLNSYSATQLADFLRRTTELGVIFISWLVYRLVRRGDVDVAGKDRLERSANLSVGGAMCFSGLAMLYVALHSFSRYSEKGNVIPGLIIAFLGLVTNTWFSFRYQAMNREKHDAILSVQAKLYRAKSFVDCCVVASLTAVAFAPMHPATRHIDAVGSIVVAFYLVWNGVTTIRNTPRG